MRADSSTPVPGNGRWLDAVFILMILVSVGGLLYDFIR
jgi:hypothetical protein